MALPLGLSLLAWLAIAGLVAAGTVGGLVATGKLSIQPGGAGAFYSFPGAALPVAGATVNSMFCEPIQLQAGATAPNKCVIEFTVNGGAQSVDINLAPTAVKQLTDGKWSATGSLSIKAGKPLEVALYRVTPQGLAMDEYSVFLMNKWFKDSKGWTYTPSETVKRETTMTGSQESCKGSLGKTFSIDVETREQWILFGDSFHEYVCGTKNQVGTLGTIGAQPDIGTEVTLYVNGQPVKVGMGLTTGMESSLVAPSTVSFGGIGTVTLLGSLLTGQAAPQGNNYAAAWIADEKAWRIIPNSFYTAYPGVAIQSSVDTFTRAATNGCSGQGTSVKWGEYGKTTGCTSTYDLGDDARFRFINDLDKIVLPLRSKNAEIRAYSVPINELAIDLTKSRVTDPSGTGGGNFVAVLERPWGNPRVQLTLDAAGIQSLGIKIAVGKPRFISLTGEATTGGGGVVKIKAANDGSDASFQFTANCQGVSVSPVTQDVLAGQTVTVSLPVNTLGLATDLASSCTGTVTDSGSSVSSSGSGTLAIKRGAQCIEGQIVPRTSQQIDICSNGQLVSYLPCPAGTTAQLDMNGIYKCSAVTAGAVGGPLPSPVAGATAPPSATFAPTGGFVRPGPAIPWFLIAVAGAVIAAVAVVAVVLRRRGPRMPPQRGMPGVR